MEIRYSIHSPVIFVSGIINENDLLNLAHAVTVAGSHVHYKYKEFKFISVRYEADNDHDHNKLKGIFNMISSREGFSSDYVDCCKVFENEIEAIFEYNNQEHQKLMDEKNANWEKNILEAERERGEHDAKKDLAYNEGYGSYNRHN